MIQTTRRRVLAWGMITGLFWMVGACVHAAPVPVENHSGTIRVACVGDSITYGAGIRDRAHDSYPAQLGRMLGEKWETRNFGVNGATLLKKGDKPYWKQGAWQAALDFKPQVVIIKLGTNDTKPQNWQYKGEFVADYKDMIARFAALDSKPRIYVCLPVPAYPERWGISDVRIKNEVIPLVREVARQTGAGLIDLYTPLSGKAELFPDRIHPNVEGAGLMAKEIYRTLTDGKSISEPSKNVDRQPAGVGGSSTKPETSLKTAS